jgi:hypothetical protein
MSVNLYGVTDENCCFCGYSERKTPEYTELENRQRFSLCELGGFLSVQELKGANFFTAYNLD